MLLRAEKFPLNFMAAAKAAGTAEAASGDGGSEPKCFAELRSSW